MRTLDFSDMILLLHFKTSYLIAAATMALYMSRCLDDE